MMRSLLVIAAAASGGCAAAQETIRVTDWAPQMRVSTLEGDLQARQWTIGGAGRDFANDVRHTPDGGAVIVGYTNSTGAGGMDAFVIKLTAAREIEWARTYGGPALDMAWSVALLGDGGYAVAGFSASDAAGANDAWLMRLTAEGDLVYSRLLGGAAEDRFYGVAALENGDLLAAGETYSQGAGGADFYLVRLDAAGQYIWARTYGAERIDRALALSAGEQETMLVGIVANDSSGATASEVDSLAILVDADGRELWRRSFAGERRDYLHHVARLVSGEYLLSGYTESFGAEGANDNWSILLSPDGEIRAEHLFGAADADHNIMVRAAPDGGALMVGYTTGRGAGRWDGLLVRLSSMGAPLSQHVFGGADDDRFSAVSAADGSLLIAGHTWSEGAGEDDVLLLESAVGPG
jgi:uncharacterized delta-60 repeat protein